MYLKMVGFYEASCPTETGDIQFSSCDSELEILHVPGLLLSGIR